MDNITRNKNLKGLKEYMRGGSMDNVTPMVSLGDKPPKGQGSRRGGLQASTENPAGEKDIPARPLKPQKKIKESSLYKYMVKLGIIKE